MKSDSAALRSSHLPELFGIFTTAFRLRKSTCTGCGFHPVACQCGDMRHLSEMSAAEVQVLLNTLLNE
jgi:hypothetical protein